MHFFRALASGLLDLCAPRCCAGCEIELRPEEDGFCGGCRPLLDEARGGVGALVYAGPLAEAVRRLKYERRTDLAAVLGPLAAAHAVSRHAGRVDAVVPVPLHPRRLRSRGFNQAALLAGHAARALGVPLELGRLRRVRETAPQAGLVAHDREENVRGAFRARPVGAARVLVVDDVWTTGATLRAAAGALCEAGAAEVRLLALAAVEEGR